MRFSLDNVVAVVVVVLAVLGLSPSALSKRDFSLICCIWSISHHSRNRCEKKHLYNYFNTDNQMANRGNIWTSISLCRRSFWFYKSDDRNRGGVLCWYRLQSLMFWWKLLKVSVLCFITHCNQNRVIKLLNSPCSRFIFEIEISRTKSPKRGLHCTRTIAPEIAHNSTELSMAFSPFLNWET